ncbi:MAG: tyrosine-type recombinase/integrase, partial [Methylocella sp.]
MSPGNKRPFPFVHSIIDRHGHRRHYFRRSGYKSMTLPGVWGSAEFQEAYRRAIAGETAPKIEIGAGRSKPGSVAALVSLYLGSTDFAALARATQRDRRLILERFRESHGEKSFAALERRHVESMVATRAATPHAARSFLKALRAVIAIARRAGIRDDNPTEGIHVKVRATAGFRAWSEDDIARFEMVYPIGCRARLAFGLLLYTGQRRGDVIRLGRQHVKGGFMTVRQGKTGATVVIPIHPELQAILAASKAGNLTFLTTATGKPFAPGAFTNWFGGLCRAADLPLGLSAHGLRKAMCRRLAEAGCSANQIAAISGHVTLREVARYTKAADQKLMALDAIKAISGTPKGNPPALN